MTQYWDVHDDGGLDVWDHTGEQIAENAEWSQTWDGYPTEVLHYLYDSLEGNQPSEYNQTVIADAAFERIERGHPDTE